MPAPSPTGQAPNASAIRVPTSASATTTTVATSWYLRWLATVSSSRRRIAMAEIGAGDLVDQPEHRQQEQADHALDEAEQGAPADVGGRVDLLEDVAVAEGQQGADDDVHDQAVQVHHAAPLARQQPALEADQVEAGPVQREEARVHDCRRDRSDDPAPKGRCQVHARASSPIPTASLARRPTGPSARGGNST